jgi:hypothetical protein
MLRLRVAAALPDPWPRAERVAVELRLITERGQFVPWPMRTLPATVKVSAMDPMLAWCVTHTYLAVKISTSTSTTLLHCIAMLRVGFDYSTTSTCICCGFPQPTVCRGPAMGTAHLWVSVVSHVVSHRYILLSLNMPGGAPLH